MAEIITYFFPNNTHYTYTIVFDFIYIAVISFVSKIKENKIIKIKICSTQTQAGTKSTNPSAKST